MHVAFQPFSSSKSIRIAILILLLPCLSLAGSQTAQKVGTSKDACDRSEFVRFRGKSGTVSVRAGASVLADLPALTRELTWYCGGSRERVANDDRFNRVRVTRASNGAISWTFYRVTESTPGAPPSAPDSSGSSGPGGTEAGLARVGDSKDACDRSETVSFSAKSGRIRVRPGQMRLVELNNPVRQLSWKCGDSSERVANPNAFNWVQIERAGNGAIKWVFYRTTVVTGDDRGDFAHNAAGDVRVGVTLGSTTTEVPGTVPAGVLKSSLDSAWDNSRADIQRQIREGMAEEKKISVQSLNLASSARGELRLAQKPGEVVLKYVVHENTATAKVLLPVHDPTLKVTFDLEVAITLPAVQSINSLQVGKATGFIRHAEIEGDNTYSDIAVALFKSRVRAMETEMATRSRDLTDAVRGQIGSLLDPIKTKAPPGFNTAEFRTDASGVLTICIKQNASAPCTLGPATAAAANRAVLGRSADSCNASAIWMWDSEKGRFVRINKGQKNVIVEVDNARFEWFCGDASAPDTGNDEWATGPKGTHAVRVSRAAAGGRIDWEFLNWR